jgi:hypothetical protein
MPASTTPVWLLCTVADAQGVSYYSDAAFTSGGTPRMIGVQAGVFGDGSSFGWEARCVQSALMKAREKSPAARADAGDRGRRKRKRAGGGIAAPFIRLKGLGRHRVGDARADS